MVPLLDLSRTHRSIQAELDATALRVLREGRYIFGPEVSLFEQAIEKECSTPYAISCASGSDALLLALMALELEPGDEVITTPYTFFSTVSSIVRLGLKPVFVDIDPHTYLLDENLIEEAISPRTRALLVVHLFGQMMDMEKATTLCEKHGLVCIEDAAQALGAHWKGKKAGTWGKVGTSSFYPTKNLGGFGDGGVLMTSCSKLADQLRLLRAHGSGTKYYHEVVGINSRLDTLQAALLSVKLPHLDSYAEGRRKHAHSYSTLFVESQLASSSKPQDSSSSEALFYTDAEEKAFPIQRPLEAPQAYHVFNQYVIRAKKRDALRIWLHNHQIGTEIYYPVPMHLQECFSFLGYRKGQFPHAEAAAHETLALPIFGELTFQELSQVASAIQLFYKQ